MSLNKCLEILSKYYLSFLLGIRTTLIVALSGTLIGLIIGLLVGGIRAIRPLPLSIEYPRGSSIRS